MQAAPSAGWWIALALADLRNLWSTGGFSRSLSAPGLCLVLGIGAPAVLIYLVLNRARNSITTSVAVVMALAVMSGSAREMLLIGTAKRIFFWLFFSPPFPSCNCFNIISWYAHLSLKLLLMGAVFLCHISMATGWHVCAELSASRWRSSFIRFAYWEFLQRIQLKNPSFITLPRSSVLGMALLSALYHFGGGRYA